jgi:hypothetical protein
MTPPLFRGVLESKANTLFHLNNTPTVSEKPLRSRSRGKRTRLRDRYKMVGRGGANTVIEGQQY